MISSITQLDDLGISTVEAGDTTERKVAVITGGSQGIGQAIAIALAQEGTHIAILSRSIERMKDTVAHIRKLGLGIEPLLLQADIGQIDEVRHAMDTVIQRFGKIDILVNNAGVTKIGTIQDIPHDEWLEIIRVNLIGTYNMCYAAVPYLCKQNHGKIINIGSDSSLIGYPLMTAYAASKHGVLGLTRSLAEELKPYNIQVNAICPAFVDTDMTPAAFRQTSIRTNDVANVVTFLASEKANCITGEELKVYGQQDMYWFGSQQIPTLKSILDRKEV